MCNRFAEKIDLSMGLKASSNYSLKKKILKYCTTTKIFNSFNRLFDTYLLILNRTLWSDLVLCLNVHQYTVMVQKHDKGRESKSFLHILVAEYKVLELGLSDQICGTTRYSVGSVTEMAHLLVTIKNQRLGCTNAEILCLHTTRSTIPIRIDRIGWLFFQQVFPHLCSNCSPNFSWSSFFLLSLTKVSHQSPNTWT